MGWGGEDKNPKKGCTGFLVKPKIRESNFLANLSSPPHPSSI